ncbi:MAG TPA: hypothetical protein PL101_02655 [Bacteroidales bacterium]|jgi:hypothetical protein|nr:hypothetical protein [Bacteroidales bacterium]
MEIIEVDAGEYKNIIDKPFHAYGSSAFNSLNDKKCEKVYYLLFKEGKYRLGIIGGIMTNDFHSPFSAPFGGFSFVSGSIRLEYMEEAIEVFLNWLKIKDIKSVSLTLPPVFYYHGFITKQINCLWRAGFSLAAIDLNYSLDIDRLGESYTEKLWRNSRNKLRIALNADLKLKKAANAEEKMQAYQIIAENRNSRGYPLRMTWEQIEETTEIISADFFLVEYSSQQNIASAIVFHVASEIVQVIYWGDLPGYSEIKPMNFLAYSLFVHYKNSGKRFIDVGPSTENSVPNYGLSEFKEGIGCDIFPKISLVKALV